MEWLDRACYFFPKIVRLQPLLFPPAVSKRGRAATEELKQRNRAKLEELKKAREAMLPEGWRKVESRSRPGEFVYENVYTVRRLERMQVL